MMLVGHLIRFSVADYFPERTVNGSQVPSSESQTQHHAS
jgi:hypothetical protein